MKTLFTILTGIFCCTAAFATEQEPDRIIIDGTEYMLFSNPLEEFFGQYPEKRPETTYFSTALWRSYIATYEIRDNRLCVKDIEVVTGSRREKWKSVLYEVFPGPVRPWVNWFTGLLVVPMGKPLYGYDMGYSTVYERYMLLEIEKGVLTDERRFEAAEYEDFKRRQFEAFKQTKEYREIIAEMESEYGDDLSLMKELFGDDFIESFLRDYIIGYTSKILVE